MAHLAFRAEWVETPRLPAFAAPCWAGGAASGGGETAVGAVGSGALLPAHWQVGAAGWAPCPAVGCKMLTLPRLPTWRLPATPFFMVGRCLPLPLRCFPCKATLVLLNLNWAMGEEDFRGEKPFAFCPVIISGSCCIKLQVQSYAHLGGNFSWRKFIIREGF